MRARVVGISVVAATWALAATPALAQPGAKKAPAPKVVDPRIAEARRLFNDGAIAYGTGAYEQAIKLWEQSYDISHEPLILDNLANAWEKLGDLRKTREYLAKWREAAPPEEQPMLDLRLKTLDARIAREDENARRLADEQAARDARARAAAAKTEDKSWLPGAIVASVGGAAVIAGVVVDVVASTKRPPASSCAKSMTGQTLCMASAEDAINTSNRMAIAGDVTWIVGAVAVTTGVVLIVVRRPKDAAPPPVAPPPTAWIAPRLGGLSLQGRF